MPPKKRTIAETDTNVPRTKRVAKKTHVEKENASEGTAMTGEGQKANQPDSDTDWDKALEQVNEELANARDKLSEARFQHEETIGARDGALAKARNDHMDSLTRRERAEQRIREQYRAIYELLEPLEGNLKEVEKKKVSIQNKRRKHKAVVVSPGIVILLLQLVTFCHLKSTILTLTGCI